MVMCDTYTPQGEPLPTNKRHFAKGIFDKNTKLHPWYGFEQEYTLFEADRKTPLCWPEGGYPQPQGPYYCSAGADVAFGRNIVEAHYSCCLYAGIQISGINAEVMPGQWEFQVGPVEGIDAADQLFMARYILLRVAEQYNVAVSFDPKPVKGDWNGSGMHTNFSTVVMRGPGKITRRLSFNLPGNKCFPLFRQNSKSQDSWDTIIEAIEKLGKRHMDHIQEYGEGNDRRLTGRHETAPMNSFSYGVANRGASIRIPRQTERDRKGYFEDRRPASNGCPYTISAKIFETACIWDGSTDNAEVRRVDKPVATVDTQ